MLQYNGDEKLANTNFDFTKKMYLIYIKSFENKNRGRYFISH